MNDRIRRAAENTSVLLAVIMLTGWAVVRPKDFETPIERRYREDTEADHRRQQADYRRYRGER